MRGDLRRREFLKLAAGGGVLCASKVLIPGCGVAPAILDPLPPASPTTEPARVAAVRGRDLYAMTRQALEAVGGAGAIVKPGETVFVKPSFLTVERPNRFTYGRTGHDPFGSGECTKPDILIAIAEACLEADAGEVIIGDGAQVVRFDWNEIRTLDGSTTLAAAADRLNATYEGKVTLACLNADSPTWDGLPSPGTSLEKIYVSSLVARADRVISVPVLKTHRHLHLTLSLKNFMGVASLERYDLGLGYRSRLHFAAGGVPQCSLNIVNGLKPDLAIIDASIGCEATGPYVGPREGRTVDLRDRLGDWLLLAGTDLVATDATAARVIGHDVDRVDHLRMAYEQGLGQAREDMIEVVGARLDELRVDWEPARISPTP